jgi:flagellar basal-body rod protein FlgC
MAGINGLGSSLTTALSGALAQTQRLSNSASNVANARSTGAIPGTDGTVPDGKTAAYAPTATDTVATNGGGTRAVSRPVTPAYIPEYQPDSPQADENGLIAAPNVDPVTETTTQISALSAYKANLAVIRTQDDMEREAINTVA